MDLVRGKPFPTSGPFKMQCYSRKGTQNMRTHLLEHGINPDKDMAQAATPSVMSLFAAPTKLQEL